MGSITLIQQPNLVTRIAQGDVSAHRVVKVVSGSLSTYCNAADGKDRPLIAGISIQAASSGYPFLVQLFGVLVEPSWSWTPGGIIYCGVDGVLTQSFDHTWSWSCLMGTAIDRITILIRINNPIAHSA